MTHFVRRIQTARGFTLIEIIMTIIILGLSSLILIPFFGSIISSPDPIIRERAISLGQALMDEILAKKWDQNTPYGGGPICTSESGTGRGTSSYTLACPEAVLNASAIGVTDAGETAATPGPESAIDRSMWNDVDDYNGLTGTDSFKDQDNQSFNLSGYSRAVTVRYIPSNSNSTTASTPAGATAAASATDSKRVVVAVTSPRGETFYFVAVVCNI